GLDDLAAAVLQLPNELGNPDMLAARLSEALKIAVDAVSPQIKDLMAEALDLPVTDMFDTTNKKNGINAAATRAFLVVATAMMFHLRLDSYLRTIKPKLDMRKTPPVKFTGDWPPMTARACAAASAPQNRFIKAWNTILAVDYRPIFETAHNVLMAVPPDIAATRAVSVIAEAVVDISEEAASLRHDLLGRIFHRILDSAKFDGSYYTSTAAACMLAALALDEKSADWQNAESIGKLRIIDPACGTGTLLMAASERARDLANRTGGVNALEKILIENVLYGYDTNLTATHLAATTLGLLAPATEFSKMNIERTFLGVDKGGQASLGSLEFIPGGQPSLLGWAGGQQHVDSKSERTEKIPEFDLVIMNPPFTRDSLRHNQFSREHEVELKKRERNLFKKYLGRNGNGEAVLHMSSQGNNFVVLAADRLLRKNGKMAAVLPMVTATNPSSLGVRKFIAQKFDIEKIIVSHDPKRPAFSENTGISELLIVCKKREPNARPKPASVFALSFNPDTPAEAIAAANAIAGKSEKSYIAEYIIPPQNIADGDWWAVQFLTPRLCYLFNLLRAGKMFPVRNLSDFGKPLSGAGVRTSFDKTPQAETGMIALWNHKTNITTTMAGTHDNYITPKPGKEKTAETMWGGRAKLMLPARLWLPLTRAPSVLLARPAVASAWYPFTLSGNPKEPKKTAHEKILCLYFNSSAGILAMMGTRDFKKLGYPNFSVNSIGKLPVPDLDKLPPRKITELAAAFDKYAKEEFLPLRDMAECETRRAVDNAVAAIRTAF
ncbi:MAG: N-6 DNA methylase, partial [Betaproteobacteria bacterium]|nr:N-6 DNA methylase [Betaproteobacteria bacterium]